LAFAFSNQWVDQIFLLHALKRAERPADALFVFGHGKDIYFWGFVVAIMIFAVRAGISIYKGVHPLQEPELIIELMINYILLGLTLVFEGSPPS